MGLGSWTFTSPAGGAPEKTHTPYESGARQRAADSNRLAIGRVSPHSPDPMGLGLLTEVILGATGGCTFPVPRHRFKVGDKAQI